LAFSMSWPASWTMRSRAKRSGLSTMIVRAPLLIRRSSISAKPDRSPTVRATYRRIVKGLDDLVARGSGVGVDGRALALVAILVRADVCAARGPQIGDGLPYFLTHLASSLIAMS
jgi:hypothetical protein